MLFKSIIIILLLMILASLGRALYHMVRKERNPDGVVNSLTYRIALSVLLFFLIFFGAYMGWITPHAIT
ncbi:MAG: twin transmembrane helix small protein [Gammaproteobacteria bacterium]|nr:twin transmembrane helix small protein [Gammaproteobacteria bacterium]